MQKILEIKGKDWLQGLSLQQNLSYGGAFQQLSGCNPFENVGMAMPTYSTVSVPITSFTPKFLTNANISGTAYMLAHGDSKLYKVLAASPYTATDISSSIDVTNPIVGAKFWAGKYIYAQHLQLRSWDLNGNDVKILTLTEENDMLRPMEVGADGNLYVGAFNGVGRCIINTVTTGNSETTFPLTPDLNMIVRELLNDGTYLAILADNNSPSPTGRTPGNAQCRIYFWDMVKGNSDFVYNFPGESYIIGAKVFAGEIFVLGYSGLWVCSAQRQPKLVWPLVGSPNLSVTQKPATHSQITTQLGSLLWADSSTNGQKIIAYGNPIDPSKKILYQPYSNTGTGTTALASCGSLLFSGSAGFIWVHNDSTQTRGTVTVEPTSQTLSNPFTFGFTKVTLEQPLSAGQSVQHGAFSQVGTIISAYETQSYNSAKPKQTLIFKRNATGATQEKFEEIAPVVVASGGAAIQRIAMYATPIDDGNNDL